jgi:hypothetical protein
MRAIGCAAVILALLLVRCVSEERKVEKRTGVTRSVEEFMEKYPDLDPSYFHRVAEAELVAEQGKNLYDEYYRKKNEENVKDFELAAQGRSVLKKALDMVYYQLYKETQAQSLLRLYAEISPFAKDLAREIEPEE